MAKHNELVKRLREDHPDYLTSEAADAIEALQSERDAFAAEVKRLREALTVFADDRNWFDVTEGNNRYPAWRGGTDEPEVFACAALKEGKD